MKNDRAYININKKNLINNIKNIKSFAKNKKICAVIKDNAYGHCDMEVAKILEPYIDFFAVSTSDEAIQIKKSFKNKNILILSFNNENIKDLINNDIHISISSIKEARIINMYSKQINKKANIHLAINTGMNRIGFNADENTIKEILKIKNMQYINIVGIFSHYFAADEFKTSLLSKKITLKQKNIFDNFIKILNSYNINFKYTHIANSSGILFNLFENTNMIRPGIMLYGIYPSKIISNNIQLKEVLSLYSHITFIKDINENEYISYGTTFKSKKKMKIATVSIGYGDGLNRLLSNKFKVIVNGQFAKIVGNITMDQTMIDISNIKCKVGDKVTIIGKDKNKTISIYDISGVLKTIPHEIFTSLSKRLKRNIK